MAHGTAVCTKTSATQYGKKEDIELATGNSTSGGN